MSETPVRRLSGSDVVRHLAGVHIVVDHRRARAGEHVKYQGDTFVLRHCAADPMWKCSDLHGDAERVRSPGYTTTPAVFFTRGADQPHPGQRA